MLILIALTALSSALGTTMVSVTERRSHPGPPPFVDSALPCGWLTVNQFRLSIGDRAASVRWQSNLGDHGRKARETTALR